MKELEMPVDIKRETASCNEEAKKRERKALTIGYLYQINKLKIELSIKISNYDIYPTQSQVDYLAGVNTFLTEMLKDINKQIY